MKTDHWKSSILYLAIVSTHRLIDEKDPWQETYSFTVDFYREPVLFASFLFFYSMGCCGYQCMEG